MKKRAKKAPFRKFTASGKMLLPNAVSITVNPTFPGAHTLRLRYSETLPTRSERCIAKTLEIMKAVAPEHRLDVVRDLRSTTVSFDWVGTHEEIGAFLGSEFMCWSPVGTLSIHELLVLLTAKASGVDPTAPPRRARRPR